MWWVFGLWTPSPYQSPCPIIPPWGRYQVGPFFSFFLYILTSMEGSAPVCCTIKFMTTMCFQAILQTAIENNLLKVNDIDLHTRSKFGNILTISSRVVKVYVAPSLWHDHDQSLSNKMGMTMSIMLIKVRASLSKMFGEFSINNSIFIQKSEKRKKTKISTHRNYQWGQYFNQSVSKKRW